MMGHPAAGDSTHGGIQMYRAHTVSVGIAVSPKEVYDYASDPSNLPVWAPGS